MLFYVLRSTVEQAEQVFAKKATLTFFKPSGVPETQEWLQSSESRGFQGLTQDTPHRHIVHLILASSLSAAVCQHMVGKLILEKADLNVLNGEGKSPLRLALEKGQRAIAFMLLEVVAIQEQDLLGLCAGRSLLSIIIDPGQVNLLENFLRFLQNSHQRAVIHLPDEDNRSPLQIAYQREGGVGVMTIKLLEYAVDTDIPDESVSVETENLLATIVRLPHEEGSRVLQRLFKPVYPSVSTEELAVPNDHRPLEYHSMQQYYGMLAAEAVQLGNIERLCFLLGYSQQYRVLRVHVVEFDRQQERLLMEKDSLKAQIVVLKHYAKIENITVKISNSFFKIFYWICVYQFKMSERDFERMMRSFQNSEGQLLSGALPMRILEQERAVRVIEEKLAALQKERDKLKPYEKSLAELMTVDHQLVFFESFLQPQIKAETQAAEQFSLRMPVSPVPYILKTKFQLLAECHVAKLASFTHADMHSPLLRDYSVFYVRTGDGVYYIEQQEDGRKRSVKLDLSDTQLSQFDTVLDNDSETASIAEGECKKLSIKQSNEMLVIRNQVSPLQDYLPRAKELPVLVEDKGEKKTLMMIALQRGQWATASYLLSALENPFDEAGAYYTIHQFLEALDAKLPINFQYVGDYVLARTEESEELKIFYCFYDGSLASVNITLDETIFYETIVVHMREGIARFES